MTSVASESDRIVSESFRALVERLILEQTAANEVERIYETHRPLLEKHGWRVAEVLGSGKNGTAYALDDGQRVMKITLDDTEARSSHAIQGRRNERIVNIEKVFRLPEREGLRPAYVLIQERLYPLGPQTTKDLDWAINFVDLVTEDALTIWTRGWEHFRRAVENAVDRIGEEFEEKLRRNGFDLDRDLPHAFEILQEIGVDEMMDETLRRGIRYYDYHIGNILQRKDGTPVINDLGVSQAIKSLEPPTLERRLRESVGDERGVRRLLDDLVPLAVRYAVRVCRSMKSCGTISDIVAQVAESEGLDCLVVSSPGHFYNVFPLEDGSGLLVDLTSLQFSMKYGSPRDTDDPHERAEIEGQLAAALADPFAHVTIKRVDPGRLQTLSGRASSSSEGGVGGKFTLDRLRKAVGRVDEAPVDSAYDTGAMMRKIPKAPGRKPSKAGALTRLTQDYDELLAKHGIVPTKVLGEGTMGVAYEMKDGRVLKVTTDKDEAIAAFKVLKLRGIPGVVRVEKVFRFPEEEIYGIVQEKLEKLPAEVDKIFLWAFKKIVFELFGKRGQGNTDRGWKHFVTRVNAEANEFDPEHRAVYQRALAVYQKLGLDKTMDALTQRGIRFHDLHPGNLMMRKPGEYVVIDLGVSDVAGGQVPPVLETFVESLVGRIVEKVELSDVEALRHTLESHGIRLGEYIGGGMIGHAFELAGKPNVVVKITDDENEARSSFRVQRFGKNLRHVVRIFDVRRIPTDDGRRMYVITQERLQQLTPEDDAKVARVTKMVRLFRVPIPDDRAMAAQVLQQNAPDRAQEILGALDEVQYFEAMAELRSIGVRFRDYHAGNVMKRGQDFVVIDLGLSKVRGAGEPPELAAGVKTEDRDPGEEPREIGPSLLDDEEVDQVWDVLERFGVRLGGRLGSGAHGDVFEIVGKPRTVLKITSDPDEIQTAAHLKRVGRKLKHVYHVFDVRRVPLQNKYRGGNSELYIIVQERLEPLQSDYEEAFREFVETATLQLRPEVLTDPERLKVQVVGIYGRKAGTALRWLKTFQVPEIVAELRSVGVTHGDLHAENIMKRGDDYVVIDLGAGSKAPKETVLRLDVDSGGDLDLEVFDPGSLKEWRVLLEGPADKVAVVAAPLNPFSSRQAEFVRRVANSVDKVVLLLPTAGTGVDPETRLELVRGSLRDVERKVEVFPRKDEDDLVGALEGLVDGSPALRPGAAFELYVPAAHVDDARAGLRSSGVFGESPVVVRPIDDKVAGEDHEAQQVLRTGDVEKAKRVLDPHLFSDPEEAERIVSALGAGAKVESFVRGVSRAITEDLSDIGGEDAIRSLLGANATQLKLKKSVDVEKLKLLGSGQKGSAFLVRPGLVLKVTTDAKEAQSSMAVKGKTLKHVARIEDVFRFGKTPGINDDVFGVVMEELEPLDESEQSELNRAMATWRDVEGDAGDQIAELLANNRIDEMLALLRQTLVAERSSEISGTSNRATTMRQRIAQQIDEQVAELRETLDKYKIPEMVKELQASGVEYADYKAENMGKRRDGTLVVFDLGASRSQAAQPPVFESTASAMRGHGIGGDRQHAYAKGPTGRSERPADEWSFEDERALTLGRLSAP